MNVPRKHPEKQFTEEDLRRYLRAYLLSSELSLTDVIIVNIIKAYRFKLPLEILGQRGKLLECVIAVLDTLEVRYLVDESPKRSAPEIDLWLKSGNPKTLRAWVPDAKSRFHNFQDFEVLVPFAIENAIHELRRREPTITTPQIDSLYLVYLKAVAAHSLRPQDLEDRVFRDVIDYEKLRILSPNLALSYTPDLITSMYGCLMEMSPMSLLYIGCDPGDGSCRDVPLGFDLQNHPLNRHGASVRATHSAACTARIGSARYPEGTADFPRCPRVIRRMQR